MPKVTVVQVIYNSRKYISAVFESIFKQTFKDFSVVAVISGNDDGGKELLMEKFPQVQIIDPGHNIGFAKGHNLAFSRYRPDFFQLVNPDLIMEPSYIENIIKAFEDPKVGAATGKLYKISNDKFQISNENIVTKILDTTGVTISKSGRARDRGQHEQDFGQYDKLTNIQAVSAAGAMYRASALNAICYLLNAKKEFFDEDFHSYWEDVDLSWRMSNAGWKNVFVPSAIGYHGRGAGSSQGGYLHFIDFIKHHRRLPAFVRQLNYKNHIFMYVKNSRWLYPHFFVREFLMLIYVLIFETRTLKVFPEMIKLLPKMWKKRKYINANIVHGRALY